ncbi:DNA polymerase I A, chloroplastic/mitochondrial [Porphyridium purpureum]|uniref:DNA polymerase I A, chloroplastic/mitochondrial n=1 Tax=Porphyridium purpureum TaxID=35688 RepID=A0A5J4Z9D2_PORPP|nr:DNA polymerase I A, chloroplastic/mitochondrial [Porphyridium purpureum]|eukprot:POR1481..scf295_1
MGAWNPCGRGRASSTLVQADASKADDSRLPVAHTSKPVDAVSEPQPHGDIQTLKSVSRLQPPYTQSVDERALEEADLEWRLLVHQLNSDGEVPFRVIDTVEQAKRLVRDLTGPQYANVPHAWDTETINCDPAEETPYGSAKVICLSVYAGADLGRVWICNHDHADGLIQVFKEYFESPRYLKVWHNYSFDRAVLYNHGIDVQGLGADTMHMARLYDTSWASYSLENVGKSLGFTHLVKTGMQARFGKQPKRLVNGLEKTLKAILPSPEELQRDKGLVVSWIDYSTLDAQLTFEIHAKLVKLLQEANALCSIDGKEKTLDGVETMYDLYFELVRPFGALLTDMERTGFYVQKEWLQHIQAEAESEKTRLQGEFVSWAQSKIGGSEYWMFNPDSKVQLQQLLFAPYVNPKTKVEILAPSRTFVVENEDGYVEEGKEQPKKKRPLKITGLGIKPVDLTVKGAPSASSAVLRKLAGFPRADPPKYGLAFKKIGEEGCLALDSVVEAGQCATLLSTFIIPLQLLPDQNGRIHASLNMNTETGRLSCRRPNLQNQPAFEKDRFKIRKGFSAEPGNSLIVADYGQLELRLLAHITRCKSMIDAFRQGGDFHSRTALSMYDHIKEAVEKGEVRLDKSEGGSDSDIPLIKDKYANERRKAKILNFSIAYGKTAMGLSKDWDVSVEEAQETVNAWYRERQEIRNWQDAVKDFARKRGAVVTLCGRRRILPDIVSTNYKARAHAERGAINTPLQGSAADVVMAAMAKLAANDELKRLGWSMTLQIHDEIILEGPESNAERAAEIVRKAMEHPFPRPLLVDLSVDLKIAQNWYEAK